MINAGRNIKMGITKSVTIIINLFILFMYLLNQIKSQYVQMIAQIITV